MKNGATSSPQVPKQDDKQEQIIALLTQLLNKSTVENTSIRT